MCWSLEASATLATIGLGSTLYAVYKGEPAPIWIALGYFSLMEALQAYTYSVIDSCSPSNQIATLLGYLHITFQPFFINLLSLHFIPEKARKKIQYIVYTICFISCIVMIIQMYPFNWAGRCAIGRSLCGSKLCSVHGSWHIAWLVPTNGIGNWFYELGIPFFASGYPTYVVAAFLMPILYGSWRATLYHWAMGPFLAGLTTNDVNEWPAIWCLLSIGLLLIIVKTPIRKILYIKKHILNY